MLPILLIGPVVLAAVGGLGAGAKAAVDNSKANKMNKGAQALFDVAKVKLEAARETTVATLEELGEKKLNVWQNQVGRFVDVFGKIKSVEFEEADVEIGELPTPEEIEQMERMSLRCTEILGGGAAVLGAGSLAGVGAYGGVLLLGKASTGTAIGTLSGAAATNATLAWLGGGSIAAGGMGVAGGIIVLGGIVAGPILLVGGGLMHAKARKKLAQARANNATALKHTEEMGNAAALLESIKKIGVQYSDFIDAIVRHFDFSLAQLDYIIESEGNDFGSFTKLGKKKTWLCVEMAGLIKSLLDTPLLTRNGTLRRSALKKLNESRRELNELITGNPTQPANAK